MLNMQRWMIRPMKQINILFFLVAVLLLSATGCTGSSISDNAIPELSGSRIRAMRKAYLLCLRLLPTK